MTMTGTFNEKFNSIELHFDSKPSAEIRDQLKAHGFRWHNLNKLWYAKQSTKASLFAAELYGKFKPADETPAPAERKVNKYGIGVGDIFHTSWGYEQTNNDFFQVVALVGECSVRIREVYPRLISEKGVSGMAADYTFEITDEILPPAERSVFIDDQEKGDLKRLQVNKYSNTPYIKIASYATAHHVTTDKITVYESWYA